MYEHVNNIKFSILLILMSVQKVFLQALKIICNFSLCKRNFVFSFFKLWWYILWAPHSTPTLALCQKHSIYKKCNLAFKRNILPWLLHQYVQCEGAQLKFFFSISWKVFLLLLLLLPAALIEVRKKWQTSWKVKIHISILLGERNMNFYILRYAEHSKLKMDMLEGVKRRKTQKNIFQFRMEFFFDCNFYFSFCFNFIWFFKAP